MVFAHVGRNYALMEQLYGNLEEVGGVFTLTRACCEESVATLKKCRDLADDDFQLMVKRMPVRENCILCWYRQHNIIVTVISFMIVSLHYITFQVFTPLMQLTASAVCSYMHSSCVARTNVDDTEVCALCCIWVKMTFKICSLYAWSIQYL